jgi:hypothetical protein
MRITDLIRSSILKCESREQEIDPIHSGQFPPKGAAFYPIGLSLDWIKHPALLRGLRASVVGNC